MLPKFHRSSNMFGVDLTLVKKNVKFLKWVLNDYNQFKKELQNDPEFPLGDLWPILSDKLSPGGEMSGHYFHQDLHVAKLIYQNNPVRHVDIGSRVDGFVAHVAVFREIEIFDIRAMTSHIPNIKFRQMDFTNIESSFEKCTDSISSLHAIEHFGLGRYNDPIDVHGHLKGLESIHFCLKPGGSFYFSVPIGPQRVEFNAHRVFSISYLLKLFKGKYELKSFSYVDDNGDFHKNPELTNTFIENSANCNFGCGIFELIKL